MTLLPILSHFSWKIFVSHPSLLALYFKTYFIFLFGEIHPFKIFLSSFFKILKQYFSIFENFFSSPKLFCSNSSFFFESNSLTFDKSSHFFSKSVILFLFNLFSSKIFFISLDTKLYFSSFSFLLILI